MNVKRLLLGCCLTILQLGTMSITANEYDLTLNEQLIKAVKEGDTLNTAKLLNDGADPDMHIEEFRNRNFHTIPLLYEAVMQNQTEIILLLLKHGADVNQRYSVAIRNTPNPFTISGTALIGAVLYKHWNIVRLLVEHGADVNVLHIYDYQGYRPPPWDIFMESVLDVAISVKAPEATILYLVEHGATPFKQQNPKE